jgi:hypothetical protein
VLERSRRGAELGRPQRQLGRKQFAIELGPWTPVVAETPIAALKPERMPGRDVIDQRRVVALRRAGAEVVEETAA